MLALSAIWGSSFLLMAIGLNAFEPGLVTLIRVGSHARRPPRCSWLYPSS